MADTPPPEDPGFPARRPLPRGPGGLPVWQPPDLDYSRLIGENYAKMRKAVMAFTGGNAAKTTDFMDWQTQITLDEQYERWAESMARDSGACGNQESWDFYNGLQKELAFDGRGFWEEGYGRMGTIMCMFRGSDEWEVECHNPYAPMWDGDPRIIKKIEEFNERAEQGSARIRAERQAAEKEKEALRTAEKEQMQRCNSLIPNPKQPITFRPLILEMVDSSLIKQECEADSEANSLEEDVD